MWPAFAIAQYGLSAFACVYLARSFDTRISRPGQLAIVVLSATFPFFSAFHGAIKSLSSSTFFFLIGTTVRRLDGRIELVKALAIVMALTLIGSQFRSYFAGMGVGCAFLLIFDSRNSGNSGSMGLQFWLASAGLLAFATYRSAVGMEFALPNVDALMLMHTSYVVWDLDERSERALDGVVLDPAIRKKLIASRDPLAMSDVVKMVDDLIAT